MTQSYRFEPSLDNAYARVRRAKQHLTSLKRELTKFFGQPTSVPHTVNVDVADGDFTIYDFSNHVVSPTWSILVGECVYNLRAALDYLIYELAFLDSGQIQQGTQFPIEDTPSGWNGRKATYLRGIFDPHKAIIKTLQPCDGSNWTKILRDISNPDKHKTLRVVRPSQRIEWGLGRYGQTHSMATSLYPVEMDAQVTSEILFDDGRPVIETLQEMHTQVTNVIDMFKPEF